MNNDFGTYKNLIQAYRDILNLLLEVNKNNIKYEQNAIELIGSKDCGKFTLYNKKETILIDYALSYSCMNNVFIINLEVLDKELFMNLRKNQFKGYYLTHQCLVRNTKLEDTNIIKRYKILSNVFKVSNNLNNKLIFTLILKTKTIK